MTDSKKQVFFCTNSRVNKKCCQDGKASKFFEYAKKQLSALKDSMQLEICASGCMGKCKRGPAMAILPQNLFYTYSSTDDIDEIINTSILQDKVVDRLNLNKPQELGAEHVECKV